MAGEDEIKLDPNKLLQEFAVESRNALSAVNAVTTTLENVREGMDQFKEDFKELHAVVKGNGGGFKEGLEFKVYAIQEFEKNCPGKNIVEVKTEILVEFKRLRDEFTTLKSILLLRKGENTGAQEEKNKRRKDSKMIRDIIGDFISSKPIQSTLVLLVSGALISLGTCMGVMPKKAHDHPRPVVEGRPAAIETAEAH